MLRFKTITAFGTDKIQFHSQPRITDKSYMNMIENSIDRKKIYCGSAVRREASVRI
jgi:hypothetical protein